MRTVLVELGRNVNTVLVLGGFVALESGIARHWSGAIAAIVGGAILMVAGSWPYVTRSLGKRT
jgi:hypothetical protein